MSYIDRTNRKQSVAKKVAYGGIVNLLILVSIYFTTVFPTNKLFFFGLSSVFLAFIVIDFGVKFAVLNFISSSILLFIVIYNKLILIPYIFFFGYYAIIKYYIEKIDNLIIEWIIKLGIFNVSMYFIYLIANKLLLSNIVVKIPVWGIIIIAEIVFIVYDYGFSIAISYYNKKIRKNVFKSH